MEFISFFRLEATYDKLLAVVVVAVSLALWKMTFLTSSQKSLFQSWSSVRSISDLVDEDSDAFTDEDNLWLIGTFAEGANDKVEWTYMPQDKALAVSQQMVPSRIAHVIWDSDGVMQFACSGTEKSDVAAILRAHQETPNPSSNFVTSIDRFEVDQAVGKGLAPSVPVYSTEITQKALIKIMEVFFHRKAVTYFAAAPHRMTSIYNFELPPGTPPTVALTVDDAPCRFRTRDNSHMPQVLKLLTQYDAKATFMIVESFVEGHEEDLVQALKDGHELANHGIHDDNFKGVAVDDFAKAVDQCNQTILDLQKQAGISNPHVPYFRAPHAYYTKEMEDVLHAKNMRNVMCDAYASCPIVQDADKIGDIITSQAESGSILLIHMPERGFRDWTLPGMEKTLRLLKEQGVRVVTLSELQALSKGSPSMKVDK